MKITTTEFAEILLTLGPALTGPAKPDDTTALLDAVQATPPVGPTAQDVQQWLSAAQQFASSNGLRNEWDTLEAHLAQQFPKLAELARA